MDPLPTGTVTFVFTDIEGSTRLLQDLGDRYAEVLEGHARLVRSAIAEHGGREVSTEGDAFFCVFTSARAALGAAVAIQRESATDSSSERVWARIGLHTGEGKLGGDNYAGLDVHRAARIAATGHGGQVVVSAATSALVAHDLPAGVSLSDLGEHRLKDLLEPEHLYQVTADGLPSSFPALRTLNVVAHNLPVQLTTFLGREKEVAQVIEVLGSARLVTLTGPGGTGKTRLSLQVAAEATSRFAEGVFFVPLGSVTEPELVASAAVEAMRLREGSGPPLERLVTHLDDREVLLVLDNFEQVLPAADQVAHILRGAPRVKVLATSRSPLHLSGEHEFPVPPLPVPEADAPLDDLAGYESVALFVERAAAVRHDFALTAANARAVAEITARLDGLPLAIELAAGKVKLLPPESIAQRLSQRLGLLTGGSRDLPARQQTLRGAIEWSHDLLEEPARRLFRRLSVFAGGVMLTELEAVVGTDKELGASLLDLLSDLVDQSLLRQVAAGGEPRFTMLETIREYAFERLAAAGEAEDIGRRHLEVFLGLAEEAASHFNGPDQGRWLDRISVEHDNLRAALTWAIEHAQPDHALRLGAALWRFWQMRGFLLEAHRRLEAGLALPGGLDTSRAAALEAAGGVAYWMGDMAAAGRWYEECLEVCRRIGGPALIANAWYNLYFSLALHPEHPDSEAAAAAVSEALAIYRRLGDEAGVAKTLQAIGNANFLQGRFAEAREVLEECLPIYRRLGDRFGTGWSLFMLATASMKLGEPAQARTLLTESMGIFQEANDVSALVLHLGSFAGLAAVEGDPERAARLYGGALRLGERTGSALGELNPNRLAEVDQVVGMIGEARFEQLKAEGAAMPVEDLVELALALPGPHTS